MKAVSLWQPWASLMAAGLKTIETRDWPTRYRGPLAIHAAKRPMSGDEKYLLCDWMNEGLLPLSWSDFCFPFGAILAIVDLIACVRVEQVTPSRLNEAFGNYAPGRWAWITRNLRPLARPVPWRGMQGLFEVPDELVA